MNPVRIVDRWLALPWRGLIFIYRRLISPFLPGACRFEPSCSCYADEALSRWGFVRGFGLSVWRICRCQPFSRGGWDPVPLPGTRSDRVGVVMASTDAACTGQAALMLDRARSDSKESL